MTATITRAIPDPGAEVHGLNDAKIIAVLRSDGLQRVTVVAEGQMVTLNKTEGSAYPAGLTPTQARYIADKLYHCAELVEQRAKAKAP